MDNKSFCSPTGSESAFHVDGVRVRVSSDDLMEWLEGRAEYHESRAASKESELPKLQQSIEFIKANQTAAPGAAGKSLSSNYRFDGDDAIESLENDIKDHKNKSIKFRFLANHLYPMYYCLTVQDLRDLEFVK